MTDFTEMDRIYSPSYFVKSGDKPDEAIEEWVKFQEQCFKDTLQKFNADFDISYGPLTAQSYDIWYPKNVGLAAPWAMSQQKLIETVHLFVHGGYWQECSRKTYGAVLNSLLESGIIVIMIGYTLANEESLSTLVKQIEEAIKNVSSKFPQARLTISGHSAGAQLVAKAIENPNISKLVQSAILICGVFDLVPLVETYIGKGINLTLKMAKEMSVDVEKVAQFNGKLLSITVDHDASGLKQQFKQFVEMLSKEKKENVQIESFDEDHFSVISEMNDPKSLVSKCIVHFLLSN